MSTLQGADKLAARFRGIGQTSVLVQDIMVHGAGNAQRMVVHKTGNLRRTIRVGRVTETTGELLAGGSKEVGYARPVEQGSRPHIIRPKAGRVGRNGRPAMLAWGGPRTLSGRLRVSGGIQASPTNFAREVHHPGTRPHPFLVPGLQMAVRERGVTAIVELWNKSA